ncbi:MAG: glycosyltransferase family 9 protein [Sediminibacterium sp.]|nr:glycosyltransferase family 9 protein [Sediminibacterium sp.]
MRRILVIQTAFIGDVVLATALLESLHLAFPNALIDIVVRKGNESLFDGHPFIHEVFIWNKQKHKYFELFKLIFTIRKLKYQVVINLQRYAATGLLTACSNAEISIGFDKNPFQSFFSVVVKHQMGADGKGIHETARNHQLLQSLTQMELAKPALYPSMQDDSSMLKWKQKKYICIAPSSVWFTKQMPVIKWIEFLNELPNNIQVLVLGAPSDLNLCAQIINDTTNKNCINLAGKCSFLQSASLMRDAVMNYVNDSAPMHFCSAVNAPVTAIYCSTIPAFGYGPLSSTSHIVENQQSLSCKPCGLHGKKACPLGHFNCGMGIQVSQLINTLPA